MKKELIFEGNEKRIYAVDDPNKVVFHYNDVIVAYNNVKRARFEGKGALSNRISALLLGYLREQGIRNHLELSGVQNVCSKVYGSRAPINVIRATSQGLDSLKSFHQVKALRAQAEEAPKAE